MEFVIFGAGAWGTAVAIYLRRLGRVVTLVPRREGHASQLMRERVNNDYLPGHPFPSGLEVMTFEQLRIAEDAVFIFACPSMGVRDLCQKVAALCRLQWKMPLMVISLSKGLERGTWQVPTDMIAEVFPTIPVGALSGPTCADEVAAGKPAAVVLAAQCEKGILCDVQEAINSTTLRVYRSDDTRGIVLAGALKNIYAIGAGVCDGLKLGDNAKAAYLTRAMHEMCQIGVALGGNLRTFYGLAGFGDLVATSQGSWSRNRTFGEQIGSGFPIQNLIEHRKTVVEGYFSTACFSEICKKHTLATPILQEIHSVLYHDKSPLEAIQSLMTRPLKSEA